MTFTVTVSSDEGGTPTGNITVSEPVPNNNIIYGSAYLMNGVGTVTTSVLTAGTHQIYATYGGDSTHTSDTSAPFTQVVNSGFVAPPPAPTLSISASMGSGDGTQLPVLLTVTNTGTVKAESIDLNQITLRTAAGSGQATIASPATPIQVGSPSARCHNGHFDLECSIYCEEAGDNRERNTGIQPQNDVRVQSRTGGVPVSSTDS